MPHSVVYLAWPFPGGIKRGIYSNEAGQGTAPPCRRRRRGEHPVKQGLVQAFSVYVDTLFICTAIAFMILFTGQYNVINPEVGLSWRIYPVSHLDGNLHSLPSVSISPNLGPGFIAIALAFFAFTTIMAYYYIAETT